MRFCYLMPFLQLGVNEGRFEMRYSCLYVYIISVVKYGDASQARSEAVDYSFGPFRRRTNKN